MAKTYRIEEKVGIGTDLNIDDRTGWTEHGSNLSYNQAVTKVKSLINGGSNTITCPEASALTIFTSKFSAATNEVNRAIKNIDLCIINNISYLYN